MNLLIKNYQGIFYVKGKIIESNSQIFNSYVQSIFNLNQSVIINVSNVSCIDKTGINVLNSLYQKSLQKGIKFTIIGYGCKEIYDEFLAA